MGLAQCRFSSRNLLSPGPYARVWSCSGHSPPLSHTGQSSGWFTSRNSSTPSWAFLHLLGGRVHLHALGHGHVAGGLQAWLRAGRDTSTRHIRHMPTGFMRGW